MSDDVRCLLRLPRQWQLQVWRWVPFQPRSIGCMCRIHVWTKLYSWLEIHTLISENCVALMYLCSRLVLTCTGLVCTWSIVWILFHLFQAEQGSANLTDVTCKGVVGRQADERKILLSWKNHYKQLRFMSWISVQFSHVHASGVVCCDKLSQFKASAGGPSRFDRVGAWHSSTLHNFAQFSTLPHLG